MSTLDDWIDSAEKALDLPPGTLPKDLRDDLLGLTRDVAHGVARIAGPLTCYLAGLAVARGGDPAAVASTLRDLVPAQQPGGGPETSAAEAPGTTGSGPRAAAVAGPAAGLGHS